MSQPSSGTVLDSIIAGVLEDLEIRKAGLPLRELIAVCADDDVPTLDPMPRFRAPQLAVISEVKRSSPSKGALAEITDPAALAQQYADGGAAAISVLTERRRFGGSLLDLVAVRGALDTVPLLRKDFIVDDYQLYEARAAGADLALLIVAALSDERLEHLMGLAEDLGLTALVEVHTEEETARAVTAGAQLIGVNNRNLKTLDVDLAQFEKLAPLIPSDRVKVAESGILTLDDVQRVVNAGADVILVGEALVTTGNPTQAVADFTAVVRSAEQPGA